MTKEEQKHVVLIAEPRHYSITGNSVRFKLTDAEVATIASSANAKFDAVALEFSKKIEEIAKNVADSE